MSSILIHMTSISVYTIWMSEHYRAIVGYSPTPGQQVSAILWNITVTVWLQSQVYWFTYYFVLMREIFTSQNTETHYTVIILSYRARGSEPQVISRDYPIVSLMGNASCHPWLCTKPSITLNKSTSTSYLTGQSITHHMGIWIYMCCLNPWPNSPKYAAPPLSTIR